MKTTVKYQADLKMRSEDWKRRLAELQHHLDFLNKYLVKIANSFSTDSNEYKFYEENRDLTVLAIEWCKGLAK